MIIEEAKLTQVDRRSGLSVEEFNREYRARLRPVVITDATEDWRARSTWTFDGFRSRFGETSITVYRWAEGGYRPDRVESRPIREVVDNVVAKDWRSYPYYVRDDWRLFLKHPDLLAEYKIPSYFFDWFGVLPRFMRLVYPRIFIGPPGAVTPLHEDIWKTHAWLAQLVGRKRWILFPPEQREFLYGCQVDVDNVDLERFPRFRHAKPLVGTIGPGDLIFVPSGWAHHVTSLDPTISVTHNYMGPGCFRTAIAGTLRDNVWRRLRRTAGRK